MNKTTLEITPNCKIICSKWEDFDTDLYLEYKERSPDPWYSDTETTVDIDKKKAQEIINFLIQAIN